MPVSVVDIFTYKYIMTACHLPTEELSGLLECKEEVVSCGAMEKRLSAPGSSSREKYRRADNRRNIKRAISVDSRAKLVAVLHTYLLQHL